MQVVAQADAFNIGATEQTEGKRKRRDQNPRGRDAPEQPHPGQHTAKQQHRDDPGRENPPRRQAVEFGIYPKLDRRQHRKPKPKHAERRKQHPLPPRRICRARAEEMHRREHRKVEHQHPAERPKALHRKAGSHGRRKRQAKRRRIFGKLHGKEQRIHPAQPRHRNLAGQSWQPRGQT